jgi:(p)ppGpp synthase/HD superfamily hydrolase
MSELARQNIDIRHHKARVFTNDKNADMSSVELKISLDESQNLQTVLHRLHKIRGVVNVTAC